MQIITNNRVIDLNNKCNWSKEEINRCNTITEVYLTKLSKLQLLKNRSNLGNLMSLENQQELAVANQDNLIMHKSL